MYTARIPLIEEGRCNGCGLCVGVCYQHALALEDGCIRLVASLDCNWCTQCESVCPNGAISCPFEVVLEEGLWS